MYARPATRSLGAALMALLTIATTIVPTPTATAAPCPDVEVIFARSTSEQPGVGYFGTAFVQSLRSKVGGQSVGVYAVDYPAGFDFSSSASAGAKDASAHVQAMAAACPSTKMVLAGHSQGAGVIDLITVAAPVILFLTPAPIPAAAADHVAAVVVFGNPSRTVPTLGTLPTISPRYASRALDLCASGDPFCSSGFNFFAHFSYVQNGMIDQGATFAAGRVNPTSGSPTA